MKNILSIVLILSCVLSFSQVETTEEVVEKPIEVLESDTLDEVPFSVIEQVPIYRGCNTAKSNEEKRACMSNNIKEHVSKTFNTNVAILNRIIGKQRIIVAFKIDKAGKIIDVRARASHPALEKEAIRAVKSIPQMESPGFHKDEPVIVPYSLPITFEIIDDLEKNTTSTYPVFRGCDKKSSNEELKKCSKQKIMNFIKMSFDIEMASRVMPLEKSTQFLLEFIINKKGKVEHVNAKANHKAIAIEAIKIAKRLPKFKIPGTQDGKPVDTPFGLLMTLYF